MKTTTHTRPAKVQNLTGPDDLKVRGWYDEGFNVSEIARLAETSEATIQDSLDRTGGQNLAGPRADEWRRSPEQEKAYDAEMTAKGFPLYNPAQEGIEAARADAREAPRGYVGLPFVAIVAALADVLASADEKATQGRQAAELGKLNQAAGTLQGIERDLEDALALYRAAISMHRRTA